MKRFDEEVAVGPLAGFSKPRRSRWHVLWIVPFWIVYWGLCPLTVPLTWLAAKRGWFEGGQALDLDNEL